MKLLFILLSFLGTTVYAQRIQATTGTLPTVNSETFQVGKYWIWNSVVKNETGETRYSSERYTVIAKNESQVLIEISSLYKEGDEYSPNHRLLVDVNKCLEAFRNRFEVKAWSFKMYHLNNGLWEQIDSPSSTLAFEEKFNCDSHVRATNSRRTVFVDSNDQFTEKLFQQRRWGKDKTTWFFHNGPNAGVGAFKRMDEGLVFPSYLMRYQGSYGL